jgi:hypothetical protein
LLSDLAAVWDTHGRAVLESLARDDPGKLATIAYGLLPRDVFLSIEQRPPGNLDPEHWAIITRLVGIIRECVPEGANAMPGDIAERVLA